MHDPADSADLSSDDVIQEIRRGEIELFRQIIVRYQSDVLRIVNAMLLDHSSREDLVQQVFVRAFQRIDQYTLGRGFGKWLKAIARNLVREELRKRYRYQGRLEAYALELMEQLDADEELIELERDWERRRALEECLDGLERGTSEVIRLHYVEGRQTDHIAKQLGRSGGSIRTLLCRARGHLRKCLEAKGVLG